MSLPVIAITNASTVLTDNQVSSVMLALQRQVSEHWKAYWQGECTLYFLPNGRVLPAGHWQLVVVDDPDQAGALGYHEMTSTGTPLGKIFARLDIQSGSSWTVTLSHELLEILGDPYINWCAQGSDGNVYALEVCDPVEADNLGYEIDGVLLSDFITPSWFEPTEADRYDFKQRLTKPFEIAPGGYMSLLGPQGWTQLNADKTRMNAAQTSNISGFRGNPWGSRRHRRTIPRAEWRKSER